MYLLPSERKERVAKAIKEFDDIGELTIYEPCDCGSHVRHNNGGNYHDIIKLSRDGSQIFVKYDTTCELVADAEWQECDNYEKIITKYGDYL